MSSPVPCPIPVATSDSPVSPRKRRRRTNASGAADDCFACKNSSSKCDRRRPYCSQCLETRNECPGYKTQLTWGVGVASRGKLRGLTLPVAKSAPAAPGPARSKRPQSSPSTMGMATSSEEDHSIKMEPKSLPVTPLSQTAHVGAHSDLTSPASSPASQQTSEWTTSPGHDAHAPTFPRHWLTQRPLPTLQPFSRLDVVTDQNMLTPASLNPGVSFMDAEYANTPISQSYQSDDMAYRHQTSPIAMFNGYASTAGHAEHASLPVSMSELGASTPWPESFNGQSSMASSMSASMPQTPLYDFTRDAHQPRGLAIQHASMFDCDPSSKSLAVMPDECHCMIIVY